MGGFITGVIGILIMPWKLLESPDSFILKWLVGTSSVLGGVSGLMICEYFVIRKTVLSVEELYNPDGIYGSWNGKAFVCFFLSLIPCGPGFIVVIWPHMTREFPHWMAVIYDYAWFVCLFVSFFTYWAWRSWELRNQRDDSDEKLVLLKK